MASKKIGQIWVSVPNVGSPPGPSNILIRHFLQNRCTLSLPLQLPPIWSFPSMQVKCNCWTNVNDQMVKCYILCKCVSGEERQLTDDSFPDDFSRSAANAMLANIYGYDFNPCFEDPCFEFWKTLNDILCFFLYIFYIHSLQTTEERCVLFACWRGRTQTSSDPPSHQQQGVWIWAKVRFEEQSIVIRSKIRNVKVLKKGEGDVVS